ncbi:MAG: right-handed parallel beta-helix repeat-containing protein, partial [Gammaproteobacteria bacterium]|nr:right-handed parallel beta-helix repeat-containing protein [Gammaproteobacteria bacterium]
SMQVLAYTPPLGIPEPVWGSLHPIETTAPARPTGWPAAEVTGYYYIDNSHPNATDTNNPYGYPDKPRLTFSQRSFPAGSYVEMHGNPDFGRVRKAFNCTEANPCWLRGTPGNMPVITGSLEIEGAYLFMEYLDFNGGSNGAIAVLGADTHHISIRHSQFRNRAYVSHTSGIGMSPFAGGKVQDIVVYKNNFEALGDWLATADEDFHGITASMAGRDATAECKNIWMLENTFFHLSGNGVQLLAGNWTNSEDYLHHIYIGKNVAHDNRQSGFWSKQASHVIISENVSYNNREHGLQPGDGIGYQYGPDNIWIMFNTIYASNSGIRQSDTSLAAYASHTAYIIGNVIYDIHPEPGSIYYDPGQPVRSGQAINLWHGTMTRYILNNTIYDVHGGINLVFRGPAYIHGNIIKDVDGQDTHIYNFHSYDITDIGGNLFDDGDSSVKTKISWHGVTYNSLAAFTGATGLCDTCLETNPLFMNTTTPNLALSADSPAINKNTTVLRDVLRRFELLYGINIEKDIRGNPRFAGVVSDIGAIEDQSSPPPVKPRAPQLLTAR